MEDKKISETERLQFAVDSSEMLNYVALMNAFSTVEFLSAEYLSSDDFNKLIEIRNKVLSATKPNNEFLVNTFLQHAENCVPLTWKINSDAQKKNG